MRPAAGAAVHAPRWRREAMAGAAWLIAGTLMLALAWRLAEVLLLAFAGLLLALVLQLLMHPLQRRLRLRARWALTLVVLALLLAGGAASWFAGAAIGEQAQALRDTLPRALQALQRWLGEHGVGRWLLDHWRAMQAQPADMQRWFGLATGTLNATAGALGSLVLVLALGVYLAADPLLYRRGLLRLVPPRRRDAARRVMDAVGRDLERWLVGQGVSMLTVGVLTAIGLAAIGMPQALLLGLIVGIIEFVPYLGTLGGSLLIVLVALAEGEGRAVQAAVVCFVVQQFEAWVVMPLAQRWAVRLAPVLGLMAVVIFGLLFGLAGAVLAVPLMVLTVTLVDQLLVPIVDASDAPPPGVAPP